ncbi:MAG: hypothetical protein EA357_09600 [Micavibrio sp.]|nr:MAG: hypothetical protein EA357_09600 [Micavibrio sp.]
MQKIFPIKNQKTQSRTSLPAIAYAKIADYPSKDWSCGIYRYRGFNGDRSASGVLIQLRG